MVLAERGHLTVVYRCKGQPKSSVGSLISMNLNMQRPVNKFMIVVGEGEENFNEADAKAGRRPIHLSNENTERLEIVGLGNILHVV